MSWRLELAVLIFGKCRQISDLPPFLKDIGRDDAKCVLRSIDSFFLLHLLGRLPSRDMPTHASLTANGWGAADLIFKQQQLETFQMVAAS
eukprot:scaffold166071_cov37-Prasinocladus_malaysianus.AAC.1